MPNPNVDPVGESHAFYSLYYRLEKSDSPVKSRESMISRMSASISNLSSNDIVLDIGSGIQILEAEYVALNGLPKLKFVTLDISEPDSRQRLLTPNLEHIVASGTNVPFTDNSVSLAVSNMALDFIPKNALQEIARILKPGAQLLLNMHHPSLIPPDLNRRIRSLEQKLRFQTRPADEKQVLKRASLQHKRYLKDNDVLYKSSDQIRETFEQYGFKIQRIEQAFGGDTWWEADMSKAT